MTLRTDMIKRCLTVIVAGVLGVGQDANAISRNGLATLYASRLETNAAVPAEYHDSLVGIFTRQIARMEAVNKLKGTDRKKRPAEIRTITGETRAALLPFVDSSRYDLISNPPDPLLPSPRILELNDQLDLSADQIGRIELILKDTGPEMQVPERPMMKPGERPTNGPPRNVEGMREQMEKMREQQKLTDIAIEQILTDDQKRVYQKIKKEREGEMRDRRPDGPRGGGPGGGPGGGQPF